MGNYSIRPKRGKFLFQPDSILVTLTGGPATDINFSARLDLTKARSCTIEFSGFEAKMRNTILRDSSGIALEAVTKDTVLTLDIRNIMKLPLLTLSSQDCAFGVSTHKTGTTDETREEKLILRLNDSGTGIVSFRYLYRYEFNGGSTFSVLDSIAVTGDAPAASTSDAALFTCAGAAELPGLLEKVDLFHSVRDNSAYPKTSYATSMITGYRMLPSSVLRIRFEF
jgi:hypothetical protein